MHYVQIVADSQELQFLIAAEHKEHFYDDLLL